MGDPTKKPDDDFAYLRIDTSVYLGLSDILLLIHDPMSYPLTFSARMYRDPTLPNGKWAEKVLDTRSFAWVRSSEAFHLTTLLVAKARKDDLEKPIFTAPFPFGEDEEEDFPNPHENRNVELAEIEDEGMLDAVRNAVWASVLARTTSRPADSIFSVMGLFGITLEPHMFRGLKHPRLAATIQLSREYLSKGGRAFWLSSMFRPDAPRRCRMDQRMCTMPPMENESDGVPIQHNSPPSRQNYLHWSIMDAPRGSMDDQGYLTITVPSLSVAAHKEFALKGYQPCRWAQETVIVYIGQSPYADSNKKMYWEDMHHLLAIQQHAHNKYHIVHGFTTKDFDPEDTDYVVREVSIGGPFPVSDIFEREDSN